jgi:hypothetical protein
VVFDYYNDTPETLAYKVSRLNVARRIIRNTDVIDDSDYDFQGETFHFNSITILHNNTIAFNASKTTYKFLDVMSECIVEGYGDADADTAFASWSQFIQVFSGLITAYGVVSVDIRAPELNSHEPWMRMFQLLMARLEVYVRAISYLEFIPNYSISNSE